MTEGHVPEMTYWNRLLMEARPCSALKLLESKQNLASLVLSGE